MERKSIVVLPTGDQSEMPGGDWPSGISAYLQQLPNYAAGRVLTSDGTWVDRVPTVATFAALPASVAVTTFYVVTADEQNKDDAGNAQPSLYILTGSTKLWSPLTPV